MGSGALSIHEWLLDIKVTSQGGPIGCCPAEIEHHRPRSTRLVRGARLTDTRLRFFASHYSLEATTINVTKRSMAPDIIKKILIYRVLFFASCVPFALVNAKAADLAPSLRDLKQMSLDELMDVEVTSVSRREERYRDAAGAVTVVTQEDVRRSGATNVPDALRWVPGLHVARQNSNTWAISSRGFSSINSEKLLVLSDTRSIYTPLFSGVLWDVQDYQLSDIERIEVIRGPGAALWGANAVNGVINITTKNAADTHGTLVEAIAGTEERSILSARYGSETDKGIHYRVFGKYSQRDDTFHTGNSSDDWRNAHAGFRADWESEGQNEFTVQGDIYRGTVGQLAPAVSITGRPGPTGNLEARVAGGNILGRWLHEFSADSDVVLRAYYDRTYRDDPSFTDNLDTIDLDLQHRFVPIWRHEIVWGLNHRYTSNRNDGKGIFGVRPSAAQDRLISAFVQDRIAVWDGLDVTVGTKLERNDFSGVELQPGIRGAWVITPNHTVWAAISRASRVPSRLERDIFIDVSNPAGDPIIRLLGNDDFDSEKLVAYELGYRWRASEIVHVDVSLFENHYDGVASLEVGAPFTDPADNRTVIPLVNRNLTDGRSHGIETLLSINPTDRWRVSATYSYLDLRLSPSGQDLNRGRFYDGATPRHQFALNSYLTLPGGFELDAQFRCLSGIKRLPVVPTGEGIPGYSELDVRLSWRASEQLRIDVVGQNLLHERHVEFGTPAARGAIERGIYGKVVWGF